MFFSEHNLMNFCINYLLLSSRQNIRVSLILCVQWLLTFSHAENNFGSLFTYCYVINSKTSTNDLIKLWNIHMNIPFMIIISPVPPIHSTPSDIKTRGTKIFQQSRFHLKILGATTMTWSTYHTGDPQVLRTSVQNTVAQDLRIHE